MSEEYLVVGCCSKDCSSEGRGIQADTLCWRWRGGGSSRSRVERFSVDVSCQPPPIFMIRCSLFARISHRPASSASSSSSSQCCRQYASSSTQGWNTVIGLELHCQLKSDQKLFSGALCKPCVLYWSFRPKCAADASTRFDDAPNSNVALFDMALPGSLPVRIQTTFMNHSAVLMDHAATQSETPQTCASRSARPQLPDQPLFALRQEALLLS